MNKKQWYFSFSQFSDYFINTVQHVHVNKHFLQNSWRNKQKTTLFQNFVNDILSIS